MKEKKVEKKIDFQFTAVPMQLMTALDVNCRSMLFTLCQLSDYYADEQGVFFRTNADLSEQSKLSPKLVTATIDTLYSHNIIEVWSVGKGKGKHSNRYRLNFNKFKEYEKYSFDDLKNSEIQICTVKGYNKKGYSTSYLKDDDKESLQENPKQPLIEIPQVPQSTNNIDNIDIIYNINNKENIDIKDNIEIEDYNKNIEESFCIKINEMFDKKYSFPRMFKELAATDWECYKYFKNRLKEDIKTRSICNENLDLLKELNEKYEPQ